MTQAKFKTILATHREWVESAGKKGKRADLSYADLRCANLSGADLSDANLSDANLSGCVTYTGART